MFSAIDVSDEQLISGLVLEYTVRMGVDARLITLASQTRPTDIHVLSVKEAEDLKVSWDPDAMTEWKIQPFDGGIVASIESQDKRGKLNVFCKGQNKSIVYSQEADGTHPQFDVPKGSGPFDVMGTKIGLDRIGVRQSATETQVAFLMPPDFVPAAGARFSFISNSDSSPKAAWRSIEFTSDGLKEALAVTFKNCIGGE